MSNERDDSKEGNLLDSTEFREQRSSYVTRLSRLVLEVTESDDENEHEINANNNAALDTNPQTNHDMAEEKIKDYESKNAIGIETTNKTTTTNTKAKKKKPKKTTSKKSNIDNNKNDVDVEKISPSKKKKIRKKRKNGDEAKIHRGNNKKPSTQQVNSSSTIQSSLDSRNHMDDGDQNVPRNQNLNSNHRSKHSIATSTKKVNKKTKKKRTKAIEEASDSQSDRSSDIECLSPAKSKKKKKKETDRSSSNLKESSKSNKRTASGAINVPGINRPNTNNDNENSISFRSENRVAIENDDDDNNDNTLVVADAVTTDDLEDRVLQQLMERMGQAVPATVVESEEAQNTTRQCSQESNRFTKRRIIGLGCMALLFMIIGIVLGSAGDKIFGKKRNGNDRSDDNIFDLSYGGNDGEGNQNTTTTTSMPQEGMLWEFLLSSYQHNDGLYDELSPQYKAFLWLSCDSYVASRLSRRRRTRATRRLRSIPMEHEVLQHKPLQQYSTHTQQRRLEYCNLQESFFPIDEGDESMVLERFALATFFYSTASADVSSPTDVYNSGWERYDNWLSDKDICDWYLGDDSPCNRRNKNLNTLNLTSNGLTGTLPPELILLRRLNVLDVSDNQFYPFRLDDLVDWMQRMKELNTLNLSRNQFSGTIHKDFYKLENLAKIDVGYNLISGTFPFRRDPNTVIESIHIEGNQITGQIPDDLCLWAPILSLELYADCDEVQCPCCTYCCKDDSGCQPNEG